MNTSTLLSPITGLLNAISALGRAVIFLIHTVLVSITVFLKPRLLIQQLYAVGNLSLIIIVISGVFVGMVMGLQLYLTLANFGSEEALGAPVGIAIIRELGPVVTALLFAGRAGSSLAAEIGLMRATEQLDGLEMMAVDPMKRVIAPRFLAGIIALPILVLIFVVMAIGYTGAYLVGVEWLGVDAGAYWGQMRGIVEFQADIVPCMIKGFVFGVAVTWVALYYGYHAVPNSEGVSRATTSTVVTASLLILGLNFLLTAILFGGF